MTIQRTLLERIRRPAGGQGRELHVSANEIRDSILRNLQNVLNTCQGNCLTDERYGLPHLTSVRSAMPHSLASYEASIRATIERHEPRLTRVRVRYASEADRDVALRFEISGVVQDEDNKLSVRFETVADDSGRLRLKG
jgi:type VI secretion system lysozyme-like protein